MPKLAGQKNRDKQSQFILYYLFSSLLILSRAAVADLRNSFAKSGAKSSRTYTACLEKGLKRSFVMIDVLSQAFRCPHGFLFSYLVCIVLFFYTSLVVLWPAHQQNTNLQEPLLNLWLFSSFGNCLLWGWARKGTC